MEKGHKMKSNTSACLQAKQMAVRGLISSGRPLINGFIPDSPCPNSITGQGTVRLSFEN